MARPEDLATVARKFQDWARSLPADEQETLASWLTQLGGPEIQGYSPMWWSADNAWCEAFVECCPA